jgi:hypothetical protein
MPHRVVNFLRASTENLNISTIKSTVNRARNPRDSLERQNSDATSVSEGEDHAVKLKMHEPADLLAQSKKHHRLSFTFGRTSREIHELAGAKLDWNIESPPIVFYGDAEESTGALVSGQMCLTVTEDMLEVESLEATLNVHVVQKKPYVNHCAECGNQYTELKHWSFLSHPTTLPKGQYQYPFSILLGGHLPATMDTPMVSISYEFKAEAHILRGPSQSTGSLAPIKFERVLDVKRCLPEPDIPHHSVRIFPPTNIKASAHYTQVMHPAGTNTLTMRLDGLTARNEPAKTIEFWKLKKITWKLEETLKTIAPACEKHTPAGPGASSPTRRGLTRVETRILGERSLNDGWKSDYEGGDGNVQFELDFAVVRQKHHAALRYACDSKSKDGTEVSHSLMVELVVSKEWAPMGRPALVTQTGTGRILRMHYQVLLTELGGLGVSWDNEAPPVYQDVPPSPPAYPVEELPEGHEVLESLEVVRSHEEMRE